MPKAKDFFTVAESEQIVQAIRDAEKATSGEIRVHLEEKCKGDALERAIALFDILKMDVTELHNGVIIYLAVEDKKFAIYGGKGINEKVPPTFGNKPAMLCKPISRRDVLRKAFQKAFCKQGSSWKRISLTRKKMQMNWMTIYLTIMIRGKAIWGLILLFGTFLAAAQDTPDKSGTLVNDWAQLFSGDQRSALEIKLVNFNDTNSTQIVVITQNSIDRELNEYGTDIIEKWGIGQKGLDNGVLLIIDPAKRNTYIATGSGAEGWLPDILAKRIVDDNLLPAFKQGQYYEGVDEATNIIMKLATGEYTAADVKSPTSKANKKPSWVKLIPFALFMLVFLFLGIKVVVVVAAVG